MKYMPVWIHNLYCVIGAYTGIVEPTHVKTSMNDAVYNVYKC